MGENDLNTLREALEYLRNPHTEAALEALSRLEAAAASPAESVLIEGVAHEVPAAVAAELLRLHLLLRMLAQRARSFPCFPLGGHIPEVFAAIGETPPDIETAVPVGEVKPVADEYVGGLEYRGNSVSFIHQKLTAYRAAIDESWQAMREAGHSPDGRTNLSDAIKRALTTPPAPPAPPKGWKLVPVEPTEAMLAASQYPVWAADAYAAMLAAAPQPGGKK